MTSDIPIASYGIASSQETVRDGDYLWYQGQRYRCPVRNQDQTNAVIDGITRNLDPNPERKKRHVFRWVVLLLVILNLIEFYQVLRAWR